MQKSALFFCALNPMSHSICDQQGRKLPLCWVKLLLILMIRRLNFHPQFATNWKFNFVLSSENAGNALQILILHLCANTFLCTSRLCRQKAAISFYFRLLNNLNAFLYFLLFTSLLLGHVLVVTPSLCLFSVAERECKQRQARDKMNLSSWVSLCANDV